MQEERSGVIAGLHAGRRGGVCEQALSLMLEASGLPYRIYALAAYALESCDVCMSCMDGRGCGKRDGYEELVKVLTGAQGLIFAAPEYWQGMNGKGRIFWERLCFSGRHAARFPFAGLPAVAIGIAGDHDSSHVLADIARFMKDARMQVTSMIPVQGQYACFTCGLGQECPVSGLWDLYPATMEISQELMPCLENQNPHLSPEKRTDPLLGRIRTAATQFSVEVGKYSRSL